MRTKFRKLAKKVEKDEFGETLEMVRIMYIFFYVQTGFLDHGNEL